MRIVFSVFLISGILAYGTGVSAAKMSCADKLEQVQKDFRSKAVKIKQISRAKLENLIQEAKRADASGDKAKCMKNVNRAIKKMKRI